MRRASDQSGAGHRGLLMTALALCWPIAMALPGCGSTTSPMPNGSRAASKHYVVVEYGLPVTSRAANSLRIVSETGAPLAIHRAVVDSNPTSLILTTDEQSEGTYRLFVETGVDPVLAATFEGSVTPEPYLRNAVPLDNTHVLLVFSAPMLAEATPATILDMRCDDESDCRRTYSADPSDLVVRSATDGASAAQTLGNDYLPGGDTTMAVLTTSLQEDREYKITVTNLKAEGGSRLIDPTRNSATINGIPPVDEVGPKLMRADSISDTRILLSFSERLAPTSDQLSYFEIRATADQSESCSNILLLAADLTLANTQIALTTNPQVAGCEYEVALADLRVCLDADGEIQGECSADAPCAAPLSCEPAVTVKDVAGNPLDEAHQSATFVFPGVPALGDGGALPRVVSAASLSNTEVLIAFNKSMGDSALEASNYVIVQANVNPEVGALRVLGGNRCDANATNAGESCNLDCPDGLCPTIAGLVNGVCVGGERDGQVCDCPGGDCTPGLRFSGLDRTAVIMRTMSQNEVTYVITAIDVRDQQGNQLAPPSLLADPRSATFAGTPPTEESLVDSDGDGLPDHEEQRGWIVTVVLADGNIVQREVTSDPLLPDTDGDGLTDAGEKARMSDPRDADTDDDELTDLLETRLSSSPTNQDTDGEGLPDAFEARVFHTALYLADTDGDGFDDRREVFELNKNPRIADLPVLGITVGDLALRIDERFTDQETGTEALSSSTSTTLERSEDTSFSRSDTSSFQRTMSGTVSLTTKAGVKEAGTEQNFSTTGGFTQGSTSQFDVESSTSSKEAYQRSLSKSQQFSTSVTREVVGASVNSSVVLENRSDIAFTLSNVEISALLPSRGRDRFVPVATLLPSTQLITGVTPVYNLGPFEQKGPIIITNQEVFPNLVEDLMRDPRGLIFKVGNFDVTDEFGRNIAFTLQEVLGRTVSLTFDYGDGEFDRYAVAIGAVAEENPYCVDGLGHRTGVECDDRTPCPPEQECVTVHGGIGSDGRLQPLPLDFVFQKVLGLPKNPELPDVIVAGANRTVNTFAAGDDTQVRPFGEAGLDEQQVIVNAGPNGVLETEPGGDDRKAKTQGYDTSPSCNEDTAVLIREPLTGGNGTCDTEALKDDLQWVPLGDPAAPGQALIGPGPNGRMDSLEDGDDLFQGPGIPCSGPDDVAGCMSFLEPCTTAPCNCVDSQGSLTGQFCQPVPCPANQSVCQSTCQTGQVCVPMVRTDACTGREVLVRFKHMTDGDLRRTWTWSTTEELCNAPPEECQRGVPVGGDFGTTPLRAGEGLTLSFEQDRDRDGVPARVEYVFGSDDRLRDSDGEQLDDGPEIYDGWDVFVKGKSKQEVKSDPRFEDTDFDGLDDRAEQKCRMDPSNRDTDGDGISDAAEIGLDVDSDLDGDISPFEKGYGRCCSTSVNCTDGSGITRPCRSDGDCDGALPNCLPYDDATAGRESPLYLSEICASDFASDLKPTRLDPRDPDTDGDSVPDGLEVRLGLNPLDPFDADAVRDSDRDGLPDVDERAGWPLDVELCSDTCGSSFDGFCQDGSRASVQWMDDFCSIVGLFYCERCGRGTDCGDCGPVPEGGPCSDTCFLSNNGACNDGASGSVDSNCTLGTDCTDCGARDQLIPVRRVTSDPTNGDTDFDGLPDLLESLLGSDPTEPDTDGDGLEDFDEFAEFGRYELLSHQHSGFTLNRGDSRQLGTSLTSQDSDGDHLNDRLELVQGWRVLSRTDGSLLRFSDPLYKDTDLDGLTDLAEFLGKDGRPPSDSNDLKDATDPTDPDTDNDGQLDGDEINSNPLVPDISGRVRVVESVLCNPNTNNVWWLFELKLRDPSSGTVKPLWNSGDACPETDTCSGPLSCSDTQAWTLGLGCSILQVNGAPQTFLMPLGSELLIEGFLAGADATIIPFCGTNGLGTFCVSTYREAISTDDLQTRSFQYFEVEFGRDGGCAKGKFTLEIEID